MEQFILTASAAGVIYGAILCTALLFVVLGAWLGHTDESRADAEDIRTAIKAVGLLEKQAADFMGLTVPQWSKQLAGREPLNHYRLSLLFKARPDCKLHWLRLQAKRVGGLFVEPELVGYLKTAARAGRRVAKAGLSFIEEERQRA
jgi:hypothetical protein